MNNPKNITATTLQQTLERYWGYTSFREGQMAIIQSVMDRRDTLLHLRSSNCFFPSTYCLLQKQSSDFSV